MSPVSVSWSTSATSAPPLANWAPTLGATIVTFTLNRFVKSGTELAAIERGGTARSSLGSGTWAFGPREAKVCGAALLPGRVQPARTSGAAAASSWRRVRRTRRL